MINKIIILLLHPQPYREQVDKVLSKVMKEDYDLIVPFITDIHYANFSDLKWHGNIQNNNIERIKALQELNSKLDFDFVVFGGDYSYDWNTIDKMTECMKKLVEENKKIKCPRFYLVGNHDFGDSYNFGKFEPNKCLSNAEVNQILEGSGSDEMYYYLDIPQKETRFIMLNTSDSYIEDNRGLCKYNRSESEDCHVIRQPQVEWLANEALNTPKDWKIVIFSHIPLDWVSNNGIQVMDMINARQSNTSISLRNTNSNSDFNIDFFKDFSSYHKCNILCNISGHLHYDKYFNYGSTKNIVTLLASGKREYLFNSNLTDTSFDIYCFDYKNSKIDVIRFGYGYDRTFKY